MAPSLNDLPDGYSARPSLETDAPAIAGLMNRCSQETIGADIVTVEDMQLDFTAPGFHPETDSVVVEAPDGSLAAYCAFWANVEPLVHPYFFGRVDAAHRRLGIGTALVRFGVGRAKEELGRAPDGARVSIRASNVASFEPVTKLLTKEGFRIYRHGFEMRIEFEGPPEPPVVPDGIEIRLYRHPKELEPLARATQEAFLDHHGAVAESFEDYLARFTHWCMGSDEFDPTLFWVATEGDEIVGMNLSWRQDGGDTETGYVMTLGTRRAWRRRGIALALLRESFVEFHRRGRKAVNLGVDAQSLTGAVDLYRKADMFIERRYDHWEIELRPGRELARVSLSD